MNSTVILFKYSVILKKKTFRFVKTSGYVLVYIFVFTLLLLVDFSNSKKK